MNSKLHEVAYLAALPKEPSRFHAYTARARQHP